MSTDTMVCPFCQGIAERCDGDEWICGECDFSDGTPVSGEAMRSVGEREAALREKHKADLAAADALISHMRLKTKRFGEILDAKEAFKAALREVDEWRHRAKAGKVDLQELKNILKVIWA